MLDDASQTKSAPFTTDVQVARWQAGDETAFAMLYERFAPLFRMRVQRSALWSSLRARFQVDDVVQEAWLRVVPGAKKTFTPGGEGSFLAFASKVVDNTLIDLARRAGAAKRGDGAIDIPLTHAQDVDHKIRSGLNGFDSPTSSARLTELQSIAKRALNAREIEAWQLVEMQDYTAEEAGLAMDSTGAAVRSLLLRSRAKLVIALQEEKAK